MGIKHSYFACTIPTNEDLLDVNFRSIISDLRAITGGTLAPRSWADLSSTWPQESNDSQSNQTRYTIKPERVKKSNYTPKAYDMRCVNGMVRLLMRRRGMSHDEALKKSLELLVFTPTIGGHNEDE